MPLDFATLDTLRTHHPAWRLLRSDHAPLVASFLHRVFVVPNVRVMAAADLAEVLEDELYALRLQLDESAFPKPALDYLNDWAAPDKGWLRKFYRPGTDEAQFDLTPATEKTIAWLTQLSERQFIGTVHRSRNINQKHKISCRQRFGRNFFCFHANAHEWVLDLMRPAPDAPDGTMQALIAAAITQAAARRIRRLSLAALPPRAGWTTGPAALIWRRVERDAGAAGLRQFKMSFAPRLSPRYIAAPSRSGLTLSATSLLHAICRPRPLPGPQPRADAPRSGPSSRDRNCTFGRPMAGDAQDCASKKGPGHDQYAQAPARDP